MKKFLIFVFGVITGVALTLAFVYFIRVTDDNNTIWFDKPGEIITESSFTVFQVLDDNAALALDDHYDAIYLLVNDEDKYYYDGEKVRVPKNKKARQVGIYKYATKDLNMRTVPIVQFFDK